MPKVVRSSSELRYVTKFILQHPFKLELSLSLSLHIYSLYRSKKDPELNWRRRF